MDDEIKDDKTSEKNEEGIIEDDFDNAFKSEEDDFEDNKPEEKKEAKKEEKDKEDKEDKEDKDSAIVQKKKYREKLNKALDEIKNLKQKYESKEKDGSMTDEDRKEKAANEFLAKRIKEVLTEMKSEESRIESEAEEKLQEEIDEILEEHTDIKEKQLLDVCEEFGTSPKVALKIIREREKLKGKEKPKMPQPKRGDAEVKSEDKKDGKPKTLDDINRSIKENLRKGTL